MTSRDSSAPGDPHQISCEYLHGSEIVLLVLLRSATLAQVKAAAAHEPGKPQPVSGIGTTAYAGTISDRTLTGTISHRPVVLAWDRGVSVIVLGATSASVDQMQSLAKVAIGQLDKPK